MSYFYKTSTPKNHHHSNKTKESSQGQPFLISKMLRLIMGTLGIVMGFFGIFTNLYILLILVLHKKTRSTTEWILLHLSSCGIGASFCNIFFSGPSIIWKDWLTTKYPFCDLVGATTLILQLLTASSICALSVDRCAAICRPLRYTQLVTRKRVAGYFIIVWILSTVTVVMAFSFSSLHEPRSVDDGIPLGTIESLQYSPNSRTDKVPFFEHNRDNVDNEHIPITNSSIDSQITNSPVQLIEVMDLTFHLASDTKRTEDMRKEVENLFDGGVSEDQSIHIFPVTEAVGSHGESSRELGLCLIHEVDWLSAAWTSEWIVFMCTLLICDLIVLSIARRQRHRIVMALYQITLSAQATVTRSKGTAPSSLWMNRTVPAKSRAFRAVWEDLGSILLNFPMILITETFQLHYTLSIGALVALFLTPIYNGLLYGVRARPIRATVRSYMRKRMTNSTLQHEIQQRLSPVDGSPRPSSSRAKSFRSSTPSPNSSISDTPRRLSTNDLRLRPPPPIDFYLTTSPSHGQGRLAQAHENNGSIRKVRSFLHIPTQHEFWSGLRKPQRSPTIVITHEIRLKDSVNSLVSSSSSPLTNAEHML